MIAEGSIWGVADAKAHLSEVINRALSKGLQVISRNGRDAVIVVAAEDWERRTARRGNLAEFFATSPLRGAKITIERSKDLPRPSRLVAKRPVRESPPLGAVAPGPPAGRKRS